MLYARRRQVYVLHNTPASADQARKRRYRIFDSPMVALTTKRMPGT